MISESFIRDQRNTVGKRHFPLEKQDVIVYEQDGSILQAPPEIVIVPKRGFKGLLRLIPLVLVLCVVVLCAFGPFRIESPLQGKVVDRDTKQPIQEAVVRLDTTAVCPRFFHGSDQHELPPLETKTDAEGRFTISGLSTIAPCLFPSWVDKLTILALGYLPEFALTNGVDPVKKPVRSGTFELTPIRYLIELDTYRRLESLLRFSEQYQPTKAVAFENTLGAAKTASFQTLTQPGVFVSKPGSTFIQVEIPGKLFSHNLQVFAATRSADSLHVFDPRGDPVTGLLPVTRGSLIGSSWDGLLFLLSGDQIYAPKLPAFSLLEFGSDPWFVVRSKYGRVKAGTRSGTFLITVEADRREIVMYKLPRFVMCLHGKTSPGEECEVVQGPEVTLSKTLPGASPPIECLAGMGFATHGLVFMAHVSGERALFAGSTDERDPAGLKAEQIDTESAILSSEVAACAGGEGGFYMALKNGTILKVVIEHNPTGGLKAKYIARVKARTTLKGRDGPLNFTSMAVGKHEGRLEALYAVTGDENIYRFSTDLVPDQRIEVHKTTKP